MKNQQKKLLVKRQQLLLLSPVIFILIISGGYFYYHNEARTISKEKYNELKAIADLKTSQIMQWRQGRLMDAKVFAESPFSCQSIRRWLSSKNNSLRTDILDRMALTKYYYRYENIFILSPGGEILLSLDTTFQVTDTATISFCKSTAGSKKTVFSDFYYCSVHKRIHFDILAPIIDEKNKITGVVLVFRDQMKERAAQKVLRESERKFPNTLTYLSEGFEDIINVINGLKKSKEKIK